MALVWLWTRAEYNIQAAWVVIGGGAQWAAETTYNDGKSLKIDNQAVRSNTCYLTVMPATNGGAVTHLVYLYIGRGDNSGQNHYKAKWTISAGNYLGISQWFQPTWTQVQRNPTSPPVMTEANTNSGGFGMQTVGNGVGVTYGKCDRIVSGCTYTPAGGGTQAIAWALPFIGTIISAAQWMKMVNWCYDAKVGNRKGCGLVGREHEPRITYEPWELEALTKSYRESRRAYAH